jgi:hypothetical protein
MGREEGKGTIQKPSLRRTEIVTPKQQLEPDMARERETAERGEMERSVVAADVTV